MDKFTQAYIVAALWSSTDNSTPTGGEPLDANYDATDIAPEAMQRIAEDCRRFQAENAKLLTEAYGLYQIKGEWSPEEQAGHDFWLTRNGHGAGFWDRGLGNVGMHLTAMAKTYGECNLYVGDDKKLYV